MSANSRETTGDLASILSGPVASGPFTVISKTIDITPNKITAKDVDITNIDDPSINSQAGTPDYGEVAVTIPTTASNAATFMALMAAKTTQYYKLTVDDFTVTDTAQVFQAWVKEFEPMAGELKKDQRAVSKVTLKITGVPVVTAGS